MAVTNPFIAHSSSSVEALKSATLLKNLNISALIHGDIATGKKTLASYIAENAPITSANNFYEFIDLLDEFKEIIVTDFEKISNFSVLKEKLSSSKSRIIATSRAEIPQNIKDMFFPVTIELKPLAERSEDIPYLVRKVVEEHQDLASVDVETIMSEVTLDLEDNCLSLKRSVIAQMIFASLSEEELMKTVAGYLERNYPQEDAYKETLHLLEVPLIQVGLEKYRSQLKLSEVLGINRNTLRKKVIQYKEELEHE